MTRCCETWSILTAAGLALAGADACAQASPWSARIGPAAVMFQTQATVRVAGTAVPGAEIDASNNTTLGFELGYALSPRVTARLAVGVPPTTTLSAQGSLTALVPPLSGTLGRVKYGPAVLSLTYDLGTWGPLRPYVGAGVNYTAVMSSRDADVASLDIKSGWGSALQLGVDVPIDGRWSVFADVRKIFFKTTASGSIPALGNPPAEVDIKLNPVLAHVGIGYRF